MSQPFDNRDWDVQQLVQKNAEIERLKTDHAIHLNILKVHLNVLKVENDVKTRLIGELAEALEYGQWARDDWDMVSDLQERAKEAIK